MEMVKKASLMALLMGAMFVTGCASGPKPLYQWERYQPQVYEYFKGQSPEQQITLLEEDQEKIKSTGSRVPPGVHAHLGLLYAQAGHDSKAIAEFQAEKALFPESAAYMDFLLKKYQK